MRRANGRLKSGMVLLITLVSVCVIALIGLLSYFYVKDYNDSCSVISYDSLTIDNENAYRVREFLKVKGFTNIRLVPTVADEVPEDLEERESNIISLSVNGKSKFDAEDRFKSDAEIVITYYDYYRYYI